MPRRDSESQWGQSAVWQNGIAVLPSLSELTRKQEWNSIRAARVGRVVLAPGRKSQIVKRTIGQAGPIVALGASSGEERQKTVLLLCRERIELTVA